MDGRTDSEVSVIGFPFLPFGYGTLKRDKVLYTAKKLKEIKI